MTTQEDYNINLAESQQIKAKLKKLAKKKAFNRIIIEFLKNADGVWNNEERARRIEECATKVGLTEKDGKVLFTHANFCRDRLCNVCAWRRQVKFLAQTSPIIDILLQRGYQFIFATITIENVSEKDVEKGLDKLLLSYNKLIKQRKIQRSWQGTIRSTEITYNEEKNTYHPHLHVLIAVKSEYFHNKKLYVSQGELKKRWKELTGMENPVIDIRTIYGHKTDAELETIKYALKPSKNEKALTVFATKLKNRRLISFTGVFADIRKALKLTPIEEIEQNEILSQGEKINSILFEFDATGGIYNYYKTIEFINEKNTKGMIY